MNLKIDTDVGDDVPIPNEYVPTPTPSTPSVGNIFRRSKEFLQFEENFLENSEELLEGGYESSLELLELSSREISSLDNSDFDNFVVGEKKNGKDFEDFKKYPLFDISTLTRLKQKMVEHLERISTKKIEKKRMKMKEKEKTISRGIMVNLTINEENPIIKDENSEISEHEEEEEEEVKKKLFKEEKEDEISKEESVNLTEKHTKVELLEGKDDETTDDDVFLKKTFNKRIKLSNKKKTKKRRRRRKSEKKIVKKTPKIRKKILRGETKKFLGKLSSKKKKKNINAHRKERRNSRVVENVPKTRRKKKSFARKKEPFLSESEECLNKSKNLLRRFKERLKEIDKSLVESWLDLREPTPGDFIKASERCEKGCSASEDVETFELSKEETEELLKRVYVIKGGGEEEKVYFKREKSLPPPRTGRMKKEKFPPKKNVGKPQSILKEEEERRKELKVVRFQPQGENLEVVPNFSVSFNQPIVPVTSIENLKNFPVPFKFSPKVEGEFRWIGTQTVTFTPSHRFPKSAEFNVVISKGTKSQWGCTLKEEVSYKFSTIPLRFSKKFPDYDYSYIMISAEGIIHIEFNQKINRKKIFEFLRVVGDGTEYKIIPMNEDEVRKIISSGEMEKKLKKLHSKYENFLEKSIKENSVWFTVDGKIPLDTLFEVVLSKGAFGEEGPRKTVSDQSFNFKTYGKLKIRNRTPKEGVKAVPMKQWYIYFNNNIDLDLFDQNMIEITPKIEDVKISASNTYILIGGKTKGGTKYEVKFKTTLKGFGCDYREWKKKWGFYTDFTPEQYVNAGDLVCDEEIKIADYVEDEITETKLKIREFLQHEKEGLGQIVVYVEPTEKSWEGKYELRPRVKTWLQLTKIAVDAHSANRGGVYMFGSSLIDGSSISNMRFTIQKSGLTPSTWNSYKDFQISILGKKDGLGFLQNSVSNSVVWGEVGKDIAFVPRIPFYYAAKSRSLHYIINDRGLYKPKEIIAIKGIVRSLKIDDQRKILEIPKVSDIKWEAYDARGSKFKNGVIKSTENGSFFFKFELPDNINLGSCSVKFESTIFTNNSVYHRFRCEEFRTPEATAKCEVNPGPYVSPNIAIFGGSASYFSGGGLGGCKVNWRVTQNQSIFIPPLFSFEGYRFISEYYPVSKEGRHRYFPYGKTSRFEGLTDSKGNHKLCIDFQMKKVENLLMVKPVSIVSYVDVQDINRQTYSASKTIVVHPSRYYVGIKLKKTFCKLGESIPCDVVVVDIDGVVKIGVEVAVKVIKRYNEKKGYRLLHREKIVEERKFVSKEKNELNLKFNEGGQFFVVAYIKDDKGRRNNASQYVWVSGGNDQKKGSRITRENITAVGNKKSYEVGEEAKILISSPLRLPAEGYFCVFGVNGFMAEMTRFRLEKEVDKVLTVKIKENYIPNVSVRVYLTGKNDRVDEKTGRTNDEAPFRPAYALGSLTLEVPAKKRTLEVDVVPGKSIYKPGEKGVVSIQVKGEVVSKTLVSLIIVDEAVLSLTNYNLAHPISTFYPRVYTSINDVYLRSFVFVKNWNSIRIQGPQTTRGMVLKSGKHGSCKVVRCTRTKSSKCAKLRDNTECDTPSNGPTDGRRTGGSRSPPKKRIQIRTNFCPLACFVSDCVTDEKGFSKIEFSLPDNLTRYRIWVLANNGSERFGLGEGTLTTQLPVSIRPSLPRFLNFGDKSFFAVVLQNQTLDKIEVNVAVRMTNLQLTDPKKGGVKAIIPFEKRAEVRFPVFTKTCGIARFQVICSVCNSDFADAVEKSIPVFAPSTSEAFATYGEVDDDGALIQSIVPPSNIFKEFGGLKITTSSTALQSLTDAFLYLIKYQFDCVEQSCSRIMSIFALEKILYAFNVPKIPTKRELKEIVGESLKKIRSAQRTDGSFGFWTVKSDVNIYLSIYVAHTLVRGLEAGYEIEENMLERSKSFCENVEEYIDSYADWYSEHTKASLRAFALYTLTIFTINGQLTETDKEEMVSEGEELYQTQEKFLSMEGKAWLIFTLFYTSTKRGRHPIVVKILKEFMNTVNETPETANFVTEYGDDGKLVMLHSNRRTDGIILEVLIHVDVENKLIPKVVKGLLAQRKRGRWSSTQENCYILLALKKYFETFEKVVPDFVARIWLGEDYAGEVTFRGRETDNKLINIPMKFLLEGKEEEKKDLVLSKTGKGRLYYRIGMDYSPKDLFLASLDHGFIVERTYEGVTSEDHAKFNEKTKMWEFRAGELIRVRLKLTNTSRRYHVALVDFIPSGCEIQNPELKGVSSSIAKDETGGTNSRSAYGGGRYSRWYWYRPWYEHTNMRDERCEVFSRYLYNGVHDFSYVMRATSLGTYVCPPCKAEEMYAPEIFGRSFSEKVVIA